MANCRQACPYNTLDGCKVKEYNAICPLTNMATPVTEYRMTNGDRIRAQIATDEGLARLIFKYNIDDYIRFCEERPECMEAIGTDAFDPYGTSCQECLLRYLRQPAEVDGDGETRSD